MLSQFHDTFVVARMSLVACDSQKWARLVMHLPSFALRARAPSESNAPKVTHPLVQHATLQR
jgi:hypothetical protein